MRVLLDLPNGAQVAVTATAAVRRAIMKALPPTARYMTRDGAPILVVTARERPTLPPIARPAQGRSRR